MLGRFMKYLMWTGFFLYSYHVYLVFKTEKPEEKAFDDRLLGWAFNTKYMYQDLKELLTQPPVKCLLGDRGPAPPGAMFPKTLVLNVNGTLVHSEYKFGIGFEVLKRPGLSAFVNRVGRSYEIALFGD